MGMHWVCSDVSGVFWLEDGFSSRNEANPNL